MSKMIEKIVEEKRKKLKGSYEKLINAQKLAWNEAPKTAVCIVQNRDGTFHANTVTNQPSNDNEGWFCNGGGWVDLQLCVEIEGWDWRESIQTRKEFEYILGNWEPVIGSDCGYWSMDERAVGVYRGMTAVGSYIVENTKHNIVFTVDELFDPRKIEELKEKEIRNNGIELIKSVLLRVAPLDNPETINKVSKDLFDYGVRVIDETKQFLGTELSDKQFRDLYENAPVSNENAIQIINDTISELKKV